MADINVLFLAVVLLAAASGASCPACKHVPLENISNVTGEQIATVELKATELSPDEHKQLYYAILDALNSKRNGNYQTTEIKDRTTDAQIDTTITKATEATTEVTTEAITVVTKETTVTTIETTAEAATTMPEPITTIQEPGTTIQEQTTMTPEPTTPKPTTPEPTTPEPTTPEPTTQRPTTQEPTTSEPTTPEPTTREPTTPEQTTPEPTTQRPTTQEPTTSEPTTPEPTTREPTTPEQTTPEPTTQRPTTQEPTTPEPTTPEPTTPEPTTPEPTTPEQTTREPPTTTPESTTPEPTTQEPTTSEPTTHEPTKLELTTPELTTATQEPTTQEPTTQEPTTQEPTTKQPIQPPPIEPNIETRRKRHALAICDDDIEYNEDNLFFIDLGNDSIKDDILRISIVLHRSDCTIPEDQLYNVTKELNDTEKLNDVFGGKKVNNIYRGLPNDGVVTKEGPEMRPMQPIFRSHHFWLPIVITLFFLVVLIILSAVYCRVCWKKKSYAVQENYFPVRGRDNPLTDIEILMDEGPVLVHTNGHVHRGVHRPIILTDDDGLIVPMTEFNDEPSHQVNGTMDTVTL